MRNDGRLGNAAHERVQFRIASRRDATAQVWLALLALSTLGLQTVRAADALDIQSEATAGGESRAGLHPPGRASRESVLDTRVRLLTAELNLDPDQQARIRELLENQRIQVRQVWNDASLPSASRIGATQAISDRTAEKIRALLNEAQRSRYLESRSPRTPANAKSSPGLDFWMDPAHATR